MTRGRGDEGGGAFASIWYIQYSTYILCIKPSASVSNYTVFIPRGVQGARPRGLSQFSQPVTVTIF